MLELGVKALVAYLLGSISGSLLLGHLRGVDIRKLGSGNAGGTNALRTQGFMFALWVMVIDVGKGWVAAAWLASANLPGLAADPFIDRYWLAAACAGAAVLGHVYPVWYEFRGGKGAATLLGVMLGLRPDAFAPVIGVWFAVLLLTGYVGLATMVAVAAFPLYVLLASDAPPSSQLAFGVIMALFVCYTHRANIQRMLAGAEHRSQRLWLLKPRS